MVSCNNTRSQVSLDQQFFLELHVDLLSAMLLVLATVRCCTMLLFGTVYMFDFQCWACDFVEIAEIDNLQYTLPALERTC